MRDLTISLTDALQDAATWIGEYWPLQGAVATNPLAGRTHASFLDMAETLRSDGILSTCTLKFFYEAYRSGQISQEACERAGQLNHFSADELAWVLSQSKDPNASDYPLMASRLLISERIVCHKRGKGHLRVIELCTQWLARYFDQGEAAWRPSQNASLETFWVECQSRPVLTLDTYLKQLNIGPTEWKTYFRRIFFHLRGYASLIQWLNAHPQNPWVKGSADLKTLILMWLHEEVKLLEVQSPTLEPLVIPQQEVLTPVSLSVTQLYLFWQSAYEWEEFNRLLHGLKSHSSVVSRSMMEMSELSDVVKPVSLASRSVGHVSDEHVIQAESFSPVVQAQFIFCMDTRSEGFRRNLEKYPEFQTFAAAGFFGFPFEIKDADESVCRWQSPGLLAASQHVKCAIGIENPVSFQKTVKENQQSPLAALGLIEWTNVVNAVKLIGKQFLPARYAQWIGKKFKQYEAVSLSSSSFDVSSATTSALGFLKSIGFVSGFAPVVFICGHEAVADNNPLLSGLQCGACGANSGRPNAELAASALNHPEVRKGLKQAGIDIPAHTVFIAACHYTTTDELKILSSEAFSDRESILARVILAQDSLRHERLGAWPSQHSSVWRKAVDWSELVPELGLANHTALIIGPRAYTRGVDLARRVFLHDYDPVADESGQILQSILLGPGVVAQWINSYYYFSSVAPHEFGGGNKTIHNLTGQIGVVEGNGGDLKIGLPEESLRTPKKWLHEPRRLLWVIYAPEARVAQIVDQNPLLQQLIQGQWIWLQVIPV